MSGPGPLTVQVSEDQAGMRLDQVLAEPAGSRSQAQALIDAGRVMVDGRTRPKRHTLSGGELISIAPSHEQPVAAEREPAPYAVAFEDEHLMVVDKPAGVVVHPARGHRTGTLAQALAGRAAGGEDPWRAGIVHRLDRDTSGLLVVAKDDAAHRKLKALLAARQLHREYLALIAARPPSRTGTIDAAIGRDRRDRVLVSVDTDDPRDARTHFEIERLLPRTTLLRVVLDTGRTHQIRVHLQAIGHPVCGDRQYGGAGASGGGGAGGASGGAGGAGEYGLQRQFLHAARLAFPHPVTGEPVDVGSPLPADLAAALAAAEAESRD